MVVGGAHEDTRAARWTDLLAGERVAGRLVAPQQRRGG